MVCVPCIVIPVLLWVFHKWIQPLLLKFWNPWAKSVNGVIEQNNQKNVDLSTAEGKYINSHITGNPVLVFSKSTCNFCKLTKNTLDDLGVNYSVEEIDGRDDMHRIQDLLNEMTGERTVPRIFIGGKCIGGATQAMTLKNQGKLMDMCRDAGATLKKTD